MRLMERAVEDEDSARARYAQALDDLEIAEQDREALMSQNAELRTRADRLERVLAWRLRRDSNSRPAR